MTRTTEIGSNCAKRFLCLLALSTLSVFAFGTESGDCVSDTPAVTVMQQTWNKPLPLPQAAAFKDSIAPTHAVLQPYEKAVAQFGTPAIKAKRNITYFDEYVWAISQEGDYWVAADSGLWIDILGSDKQPLTPLTFNHGLRCAGIYKAVQFHLAPGTYHMVIASEDSDSVTFSAQMVGH